MRELIKMRALMMINTVLNLKSRLFCCPIHIGNDNADPEVLSHKGKSSGLSVSSNVDALHDKEKGVRDHQRMFFQKESSTTKNHRFELFRGKRDSAKDVSRDLDKKVGFDESHTRPFLLRNLRQTKSTLRKEMEMWLEAENIGVWGYNEERVEENLALANMTPTPPFDLQP